MTEFPEICEEPWSDPQPVDSHEGKKKRWRLQFNLRTLLAAMAISAIVFACWTHPQAVAWILVPAMPLASIICLMFMNPRRWWLGVAAVFGFINCLVGFAGLFVGGFEGLAIIGISFGVAIFIAAPVFAALILYSFVAFLFEEQPRVKLRPMVENNESLSARHRRG